MIEEEIEINLLALSTEVAAQRSVKVTTERYILLVSLKNSRRSKENFKRSERKQEVFVTTRAASVKQLLKKMRTLCDETGLPLRTNEESMRAYSEKKMKAGKLVRKLMKSAAARFVGMAGCISRVFPKWCLQRDSESDYFSRQEKRY